MRIFSHLMKSLFWQLGYGVNNPYLNVINTINNLISGLHWHDCFAQAGARLN